MNKEEHNNYEKGYNNFENNNFYKKDKVDTIFTHYKKDGMVGALSIVLENNEVLTFEATNDYSFILEKYIQENNKIKNNNLEILKSKGYKILSIFEKEKEFKLFKDEKVFVLKESEIENLIV